MAESHAPSSAEPAHGGGHATVKTYIKVAIVLAIITAIEVATLYVPGIPNGLLVTSLLVMSVVKFVLVVGFFMHLRYDSGVMRACSSGRSSSRSDHPGPHGAVQRLHPAAAARSRIMAHVVSGPGGRRPSGRTASTGPSGTPIPSSSPGWSSWAPRT